MSGFHRFSSSEHAGYRFGFNGQEVVSEVNGSSGTHTTAPYWEYSARIGRRWNLDPKPSQSVSNYATFLNNPILFNDPLGDIIRIAYHDKKSNSVKYYEFDSELKLPRDRGVRKAVRVLHKIQNRGADPYGVIEYVSNSERITTIQVLEDWKQMTSNSIQPNDEDLIVWSPNRGYVDEYGTITQPPALGLLHELAETFYSETDPEGKVEKYPFLFKKYENKFSGFDVHDDLLKAADIQAKDAGDYQTWNDKWIIKNVEYEFNKKFGVEDRYSHYGFGTKHPFGAFSNYSRKHFNHRNDKVAKNKTLRKVDRPMPRSVRTL